MTIRKSSVALLVLAAAVLSVFALPVTAKGSKDSEIRAEVENLNKKLAEAQKRYKAMEQDLTKKTKALDSARSSGKAKDSQIKRLESQVAQQNKKIAAQGKTIQELQSQLQALQARLNSTPQPAPSPASSAGWHPKANCRLTAFTYKPGDPCVKLTIEFRNGETDELDAPYDTYKGDKFFKIENLYPNLQVVMPTSSRGDWTVNVDVRDGYVAKIDPQNIAGSKLDGKANKDNYGGKTFTSGEAFIILKQSGMTIRPPYYTAPSR